MAATATPPAASAWNRASDAPPDPKRWIALVILSSALFIIVLDNTILNVAVPTIIRELGTEVSSLQWVISGYSLVFASLLISFGRLGDIFGRRRLFFAGAAMFAVGSLIASVSHSVVQLFIGEALLEGIGAAAMLPVTLSIISATFRGRERGLRPLRDVTNVVLSDIPPQEAGPASGAAGMVRQVGTALGIALIGAIFVSQAASHVRHDLATGRPRRRPVGQAAQHPWPRLELQAPL